MTSHPFCYEIMSAGQVLAEIEGGFTIDADGQIDRIWCYPAMQDYPQLPLPGPLASAIACYAETLVTGDMVADAIAEATAHDRWLHAAERRAAE